MTLEISHDDTKLHVVLRYISFLNLHVRSVINISLRYSEIN